MTQKIKLDTILEDYCSSLALHQEKNDVETDEVKEILKQTFKENIKKEILDDFGEEYKAKLKKDFLEKEKDYRKNVKIKSIIIFIIETVTLSGIIGLIVNQITELVLFIKGDESVSLIGTALVLILFSVFLVLMIWLMYLDKVYNFFTKKDEEEL